MHVPILRHCKVYILKREEKKLKIRIKEKGKKIRNFHKETVTILSRFVRTQSTQQQQQQKKREIFKLRKKYYENVNMDKIQCELFAFFKLKRFKVKVLSYQFCVKKIIFFSGYNNLKIFFQQRKPENSKQNRLKNNDFLL